MFVGLVNVNVGRCGQGLDKVWTRLRLVGLKVCMGLKRECSSLAETDKNSREHYFKIDSKNNITKTWTNFDEIYKKLRYSYKPV